MAALWQPSFYLRHRRLRTDGRDPRTDEIQVYDAEIADQGVFNLMIHTNFTPIGRKTQTSPAASFPTSRSTAPPNGPMASPTGLNRGFTCRCTVFSSRPGATINGFKLRELFVRPNAKDHMFFYGVNFEFGVNHTYWESKRITSETRPSWGCICIRSFLLSVS